MAAVVAYAALARKRRAVAADASASAQLAIPPSDAVATPLEVGPALAAAGPERRRSIKTRVAAAGVFALATALFALTGASVGNASEPTATHSFDAVADAYIDSTDPDANYGTEDQLRIDNSNLNSSSIEARSYVRFDVQGLSDPVVSSVVRFRATKGDNQGFVIRDATASPWNENTITWTNAPTQYSDVVASSGGFDTGAWIALDVTSLVRGNGEVSLVLASLGSSPMAVASREGGAAPELVVTTLASAPANQISPTIAGRAQEAESLTADPGTWTGTTPISYAYQWLRCDQNGDNCASIASEDSALYSLTSSDVGWTMRVAVTATGPGGSDTATSAPTGIVIAATPGAPPADGQPPSAPGNPTVSASTQTTIALAWEAPTDNAGVVGYGVYVGEILVESTTEPTATIEGLACGSTYGVAVDAYDAAGNRSGKTTMNASTEPCFQPPPPDPGDTSPPSQPGNLAVVASTAISVAVIWAPSTDNVGVMGYGVYVNDSAVSSGSQPSATVSGLTCGTAYLFEVDAFDAAGNRSSRAAVTVSTAVCADTQPPTAPTTVTTTVRTATSIALSWSASSDNVGVAGYGLYQAGTAAGTSAGTTGIFSGLSCNTNYTLAVDAYDAAGNRSQKTTVMVATTACPDTTPPSVPTGLAASNVTQTSLTFAWSAASDNVGVTGYDVYRNNTKMATVTATSSNQAALTCGTSYTLAVEAFDAAGNRSPRAQLNATTAACPPPPPPPPPPSGGCAVDPGTMTAPGCALLREDTAAVSNPEAGLWGNIECANDSRYSYLTSGGDAKPKANGTSQGNDAFRRMTVVDGDDFAGERCELGRNNYLNGENTGTQTSGTFALYGEGERKITFFSMRFGSGFSSTLNNWQTIMQMKQTQPYGGNAPVNGAPALEIQVDSGQLRLQNFWSTKWSAQAPPNGVWIRYALDVTYSKSASLGKVQMFVDLDGDGDFLTASEASSVIHIQTLATQTSPGSGGSTLQNGDSIPGHLRLGIYHDEATYGTTTVDVDNVEIVSG